MSRSPRDDDELRVLVADLSDTLDDLQSELGGETPTTRRRGGGPPRPRDLLRFTEQYTIPAVVSVLEATIQSLELLQGALRLADGRLDETDPAARRRGERALDAVDGLLDDLQGAIEGRPADSDARNLLEEARSLRADIDDRIAGDEREPARRPGADRERRHTAPERSGRRQDHSGSGSAVRIDVSETDGRSDREESGREREDETVDVEAELDAIRREVRDEEGSAGDGDDGDETDDGEP